MVAHNLPQQPTPFVGRMTELAEIAQLLAEPACRLLTLVGPGGIGKTRLAVQAATDQVETYPDGLYFVALQPVTSTDFIIPAIADAVKLQFYVGAEPKQQLLDYFREKTLLLVLDNFEHLLDSAELVSAILTHAAGVKVLTTTRERLNLVEEWVFDVRGLRFPLTDTENIVGIEAYSAVQLFVQNVRRVQGGFTLTDAERPSIIRICRAVGGMPLGIELASAWARTLSYEAIAGEIERSPDILETSIRNIPSRHRSMRTVLEHSWDLLSRTEQDTFQKLSVFRGGFTREAAQAVAGASVKLLSALVDRSLVWRDISGRYSLHELLRQYGGEQLDVSPQESRTAHGLHSAYYAEFMNQREGELFHAKHQSSQREALVLIEGEYANVRVAFFWALEYGPLADIRKFIQGVWCYLEIGGRHQEGRETFRWAVEYLRARRDEPEEERQRLLGLCLADEGLFARFVAPLEEGIALGQESLAVLRLLPARRELPVAYVLVSNFAIDYDQAKQYLQEACTVTNKQRDGWGAAAPIQVLAQLAVNRGEYDEARQLSQEALTICREVNDHILEAYVLLDLSNIALGQEDYGRAKQFALEALASAQMVDHQLMKLRTQRCLGSIAHLQEDYAEANRYYVESLATAETMGNRWGVSSAFRSLGAVACGRGDYTEARQHFRKALSIAEDVHNVPEVLNILGEIAGLQVQERRRERAVELLALVLSHPASGHDTKDRIELMGAEERATQLYAYLEGQLSPDTFAAAQARGRVRDLDATVKELLTDLDQAAQDNVVLRPASAAHVHPASLTERELEILRLLATGLSNRETADHLFLALGTVKWYVSEIYSKLHVTNRTQAITRARELNILS